jgi:hypothetical protein
MSESHFIHKRQRERARKTRGVTTKHILGLVLLSLAAFAAFKLWVGNPVDALCEGECESVHSLFTWVFAFFLMFGGIIAAGAVVGLLVAGLKRLRGPGESAFFTDPENDSPENDSKA